MLLVNGAFKAHAKTRDRKTIARSGGLHLVLDALGAAASATLGVGLVGLICICLSEHEAAIGDGSAPGEPSLARVCCVT